MWFLLHSLFRSVGALAKMMMLPIIFPSSSSVINNTCLLARSLPFSSYPILLFSLVLCVLSSFELPIIIVAHYFMFLRLQHFLSFIHSFMFVIILRLLFGLIIYHFTCSPLCSYSFSSSSFLFFFILCQSRVERKHHKEQRRASEMNRQCEDFVINFMWFSCCYAIGILLWRGPQSNVYNVSRLLWFERASR